MVYLDFTTTESLWRHSCDDSKAKGHDSLKESLGKVTRAFSRQDVFDDLCRLHACQLEIESLMFVGEAIMLNAAEVHESGL